MTDTANPPRLVPRCRACGLPSAEGRRMIAGPGVHVCEACLSMAAAREPAPVAGARCAFCARRDLPVAGAWPSFAMCTECFDTARGVLAEGDR